MAYTAIYRRPAFINRPWITSKLYDDLSRSTILHCDAYVFAFGGSKYLQLEWREGGDVLIALDTWLIEPDGLTPVWDVKRTRQAQRYSREAALHARVMHQVRAADGLCGTNGVPYARVSLVCHYIDARETNCEIRDNRYVERKPYAPRKPKSTQSLPDIL